MTTEDTMAGAVRELRLFLAANADVAQADGSPEKAAVFREYLQTVDALIRANGQDRATQPPRGRR